MRRSDTVYLLDASIYIFKAWFGHPDLFHDSGGRSVNAVYGYAKTLFAILHELRPRFVLAAFDESLFSGFRHELYPPYKSNRALPDDELEYQLRLCRQLTDALGIRCVSDSGHEADDWLALGASLAAESGMSVTVLSRDKDLAQLVGPGDLWWDWGGEQRNYQALIDYWQVSNPQQIPDLLALMGDSSDNIPGIAGIGAKSARAILARFPDLESLYADLNEVMGLPIRGARRCYQALLDSKNEAFLYRDLIRLRPPPAELSIADMVWERVPQLALMDFLEQNGLGTPFRNLVRRHYA